MITKTRIEVDTATMRRLVQDSLNRTTYIAAVKVQDVTPIRERYEPFGVTGYAIELEHTDLVLGGISI